ncbi:MAG: hypothetical protein WAL59_00525 [Roseiarcus sp.]
MFFRKKTSGGRAYLQIVENRREDGAVRQQVIATLGRLEDLRQSGQLERLLRSGARFADKAIVVGAVADDEPGATDRGHPGIRALVAGDGLPRGRREPRRFAPA